MLYSLLVFFYIIIVPIKSDKFPNPSNDGSFVIEDTSCTDNSQFLFKCANLDFTNSRCIRNPNMPVYAAVLCSGTVTEVESASMNVLRYTINQQTKGQIDGCLNGWMDRRLDG